MPTTPKPGCRVPRCPWIAVERGFCSLHQSLARDTGAGEATAARFAAMQWYGISSRSSRVVHVIGAPATGKTWVCERLAEASGWPYWSIDAARERVTRPGRWWPDDDAVAWAMLRDFCESGHPIVIVETSGRSPCDRVLMAGRVVVRVVCTADDATRHRRLAERVRDGYGPAARMGGYVAKLFASPPPEVLDGDIVMSTSDTVTCSPWQAVRRIEAALTGHAVTA